MLVRERNGIDATYLKQLIQRTNYVLKDTGEKGGSHFYLSTNESRYQAALQEVIAYNDSVLKELTSINANDLYHVYYEFLSRLNKLTKHANISERLFYDLRYLLGYELKSLADVEWDVNREDADNIDHGLIKLNTLSDFSSREHYEFCKKWNISGPLEDYPDWNFVVDSVLGSHSLLKEKNGKSIAVQLAFRYGIVDTKYCEEEFTAKRIECFIAEKELWSKTNLKENLSRLVADYVRKRLCDEKDDELKKQIAELNIHREFENTKEYEKYFLKQIKMLDFMIDIRNDFIAPLIDDFVNVMLEKIRKLNKEKKIDPYINSEPHNVDKTWESVLQNVAVEIRHYIDNPTVKFVPKESPAISTEKPKNAQRTFIKRTQENESSEGNLFTSIARGIKNFFNFCFGRSQVKQPVISEPMLMSAIETKTQQKISSTTEIYERLHIKKHTEIILIETPKEKIKTETAPEKTVSVTPELTYRKLKR